MKTSLLLLAAMTLTASAADETAAPKTETAVIGGGCFWCVEAQYQMLKGVTKVESGYAGGKNPNPTYKEVCTGETGHAEVIRITFDPSIVTYKELIDLFWDAHDPTTLNRQGNDRGTQYRSTIMYVNDEQKTIAEASKAAHAKDFKDPIVTEIVPMPDFYPAEDYHQNYFRENPYQGYNQAVTKPKVDKFKEKLEEKDKLQDQSKVE